MPDESWLVLSELLEEPVETITFGKTRIKIHPAGLPELRDFGKFVANEGLGPGDQLTDGKTMLDLWQHVFWLLLRNGTPGMTPERADAGDWDITVETAGRILPRFLHGQGLSVSDWQKGITDLAVKAGLFSREAAEGEGVGGESPMPTPNLPLPESESTEKSQDGQLPDATGERSSPVSSDTELT